MKKIVMLTAFLFVFCGIVSFAQDAAEKKEGMMGKRTMMHEGMQGKMMGMCPEHAMMAKMMMTSSMDASADGGVFVMAGNRLSKYDKDLVLVKEVEIKTNVEGMEKMMAEMKEKCPMCKQMMGECPMMKGASGDEKKETSTEKKKEINPVK